MEKVNWQKLELKNVAMLREKHSGDLLATMTTAELKLLIEPYLDYDLFHSRYWLSPAQFLAENSEERFLASATFIQSNLVDNHPSVFDDWQRHKIKCATKQV